MITQSDLMKSAETETHVRIKTKKNSIIKVGTVWLVLIVCIPFISANTIAAVNTIFKKSLTPVSYGFSQHSLLISLVNPCEAINPNFYSDVEEAHERCEMMYKSTYLMRLENMCARNSIKTVPKGSKFWKSEL